MSGAPRRRDIYYISRCYSRQLTLHTFEIRRTGKYDINEIGAIPPEKSALVCFCRLDMDFGKTVDTRRRVRYVRFVRING